MRDNRQATAARAWGLLVAGALAVLLVALVPGLSWAADSARIQEVALEGGKVNFLLSATGLQKGEGLDPESVEVLIDGQSAPSSAEMVNTAQVQRTSYLVLDTSGSMDGILLASAQEAAARYLDNVPSDVAVGLITFDDSARVVVPATTDHGAVEQAVAGTTAGGSTALFDATVLAATELGGEGARGMVVLSDGEDEGSAASEEQALTSITATGITVDAVALSDGTGAQQLALLAQAGDGLVVQADDTATLNAAFESAAQSSASQLSVAADLPVGQPAGTYPLVVSVVVGDQVLTDEAVVVITQQAAQEAAAASAAQSGGPLPVETHSVPLLQQDWFLLLVIVLLFVALSIIALLAFRYITDEHLQPRRVRQRIDAYSAANRAKESVQSDRDHTALAQRAVSAAEQALGDGERAHSLERRLTAAAVPLKPAEWVVLQASIAILAVLVAAVVSGFSPVWTGLALLVSVLLPWAVLDRKAGKRRKDFYQSLPEVLQLLAGGVASGYSFQQAVDTVAEQSDGVVAAEFGRAIAESRLGVPIEDALMDVAERMQSRDFEWVVMAVAINRQVGGNLAEVLRTVARTLRERERVRRQVSALTAEGRISAIVLTALPVFLVLYMIAFRPDYLAVLFTSPVGMFVAITGVALVIVGILWMRRMIQVEV